MDLGTMVIVVKLGMDLGGSLGLPGAVSPKTVSTPVPVVETVQGCLTEPPSPVRCGMRYWCEEGVMKAEKEQCTVEEILIAYEQRRNNPLPADWPEEE